MKTETLIPGRWPELSRSGYSYLVRLAEIRLVGYESGAEDVVANSLVKWQSIDAAKAGVARIEQVIKTEAASWRRGEERRRARERRSAQDPTIGFAVQSSTPLELEAVLVGETLNTTLERENVPVSEKDLQALEMLYDGHWMSSVSAELCTSRHSIRRSRQVWSLVWRLATREDSDELPACNGSGTR